MQNVILTLMVLSELGQSLSDFGKTVKLLGDCEGNALGKAFSELGAKSETLSIKLQKEVSFLLLVSIKKIIVKAFVLWMKSTSL